MGTSNKCQECQLTTPMITLTEIKRIIESKQVNNITNNNGNTNGNGSKKKTNFSYSANINSSISKNNDCFILDCGANISVCNNSELLNPSVLVI